MSYNPTVGFAELDQNSAEKLERTVRISTDIARPHFPDESELNVLVAGCGNGDEAIALQNILSCPVVGVDISISNIPSDLPEELTLQRGDLGQLEFADDSFDFIYSYHVLEHVPDPAAVLAELRRVMQPRGVLFIGFPNKNRMIGYLGAHNDVSFWRKMAWNFQDYGQRLRGKFENRFGAHAGFTEREFLDMANSIFSEILTARDEYFDRKYSSHPYLLKTIRAFGLVEVLYPSNYYICKY